MAILDILLIRLFTRGYLKKYLNSGQRVDDLLDILLPHFLTLGYQRFLLKALLTEE
jgi:hypothetical protein